MKNKVVLFSLACATAVYAETIKSIEYNNLNKISSKIINETLDMRVGDQLDEEKLNNAVIKFYKYGYFDDISVVNNDGNIKLTFKEKPSIAKVTIKGYKSREEDIESLKTLIKLKKGSIYTEKRIKEAKKILLNLLESEGYINSVVEPEIEKINEHSIALTFNVNKGDEIIIKQTNYHGSDQLGQSDFEQITVNKEEELASWFFGRNDGEVNIDQLKYDGKRINELYYEKGYLDAKVQEPFLNIDFASNQAKLDFFIKEGNKYSINDVKIYVDSTILNPEELYEELKLIVGHTFNIKKLRKDKEFIKTQIADKGYAFARVKFDLIKDEKNSKVDVVFNVIPGKKVYINDVKISGNSRTLDRVIRRNVYLAPGDLYSLTDFKDSKSKLKRSGFFESVKIEEKRVSDDKIDIIVKVIEAPTGSVVLGGGYGSYDKLMISGSLKDSNIFGSGLGLSLDLDFSSTKSEYGFSLTNPAINDSKFNGKFEVHNKNEEINKTPYDLDKTSQGFSATIGRQIQRNLSAGLTYRLDFIKEDYTYNDGYGTDNTKTYYQDTEYVASTLTPYLSFNNTDDFFLPREGIKASTSLEIAGLGGDSNYIRSNTSFKYFHSLEDRFELDWIVRFRTQLKILVDNGQINQGDSLYLGGPRSLRGYEPYAFGPSNTDGSISDPYRMMWANGLEINMPLIPSAKMRWSFFYDFGMIGEDNISDVTRSSIGSVLEWTSPIGPVQLIFAQALDDKPGDNTSNFEFSLGSSF